MKRKPVKPKYLYDDDGDGMTHAEPFLFIACICPNCKKDVPYTNYCCECGQEFIIPNEAK